MDKNNKTLKNSINIPSFIEKNMGQHHKDVRFLLRQSKSDIFFTESEAVLVFKDNNIISISLDNSNVNPQIIGRDEFDCKINYFTGKTQDDWRYDIPVYEKILYKKVYHGIDCEYYLKEDRLEHDFIVYPEGDPSNIKINIQGADKLELDKEGNLNISIKDNEIKMLKPKVYQNIEGKEKEIDSDFIINNNKISFSVSKYDKNKTLIIDPPLLYGTYLGGNGLDHGTSVSVDKNGYAYVTGFTTSSNFPTTRSGYDTSLLGNTDAYLVKINTKLSGKQSLLYGTYVGGNNEDYGVGLAVDGNQRAYISGYTNSNSGFPITPNGLQTTLTGDGDSGFFVQIDTTKPGKAGLLYGTYIQGNGDDKAGILDIDIYGFVYITGQTTSTEGFPITPTAYQPIYVGSGSDVFLVKLDPRLSGEAGLLYGTYLAGDLAESGSSVAVDNNQNAYITGGTTSMSQFPITSTAYQVSKTTQNRESFLIKIDTKASGVNCLLYGTYLGGTSDGAAIDVAVAYDQYAYIAGFTSSTDFPVTANAYQTIYPGGVFSGFVAKIDTFGAGQSSLKYSSYIGGNGVDYAYGIALDQFGYAYITGSTASIEGFPITKAAYQSKNLSRGLSPYIVKLDTTKSGNESLLYGSYVSGSDIDIGAGVAVDMYGNAYITGDTNSADFPTINGYQTTLQSNQTTAFLVKINTLVCDLVLDKSTCLCSVSSGEKIPYTIRVVNNGPDVASNVVVTDDLRGVGKLWSYRVSLGNVNKDNNIITWTITSLQPGEEAVGVFEVSSIKNYNYISNTASVVSDNNPVNLYNGLKTVITPVNNFRKNCIKNEYTRE